VLEMFGRVEWHSFQRPPDHFHMRQDWLREPWQSQRQGLDDRRRLKAILPANALPEEIDMYARAYMWDLFSTIMFPD
jgi:hypothetical protein